MKRAAGGRKERRRGEHGTYANAHRRQGMENAATVELMGGDSFENRFAMLKREEQIAALEQNLKQDLRKDLTLPEAQTA